MSKELIEQFQSFETKASETIAALKAEIDASRSEVKKHGDALVKAGADHEQVKTMTERALGRLDNVEARLQMPFGTTAYGGDQSKTLGEMVVDAEAVKELAQQMRPGGSWISGKRASLPLKSFFLNGPLTLEQKTTITSAAVGSSTPGILVPQRIPGIVKPGVRAVRVRDLMPRFTTTNNAVEFVRENVFTNLASPTAESISKPESALTFTIDSATVRLIAHWIPASRQVLDDFGALQSFIDQRLIEGLKDVEDYEIVAGDGTGQHLSGLSTEATAYDTARNVAGDTRIDRLNHALAQLEDVNLIPDGIILHPQDWRAIQLIKTEPNGANTGEYLLGGPAGLAAAVIWGVPVSTTTAVTPGTFYCGAFQRYCAVYDRMDARVDISTEHSNFFVQNLVAVRAEERLAFVQTLAAATIYGSF
jgi:HK97 family phage major capsid protein